jgi:hypothetical protein
MESASALQGRPAHPSPTPPPASRGHRSLITQCWADLSRPAPTRPDLPRCPLSGYLPLQEPRHCPVTLNSLQASGSALFSAEGAGEGEVLVGDPPRRDGKASLGTLISAEAQGGCARHGPSAQTSRTPNPVSIVFDNLIRELGRGSLSRGISSCYYRQRKGEGVGLAHTVISSCY